MKNHNLILQHAIELFCSSFAFQGGQAIYINRSTAKRHCVIETPRTQPLFRNSIFDINTFKEPEWSKFSGAQLITEISDFATLSNLSKQCRKFTDDQHIADVIAENLSNTPSVLIPLFDERKQPAGFVHVFRKKGVGNEIEFPLSTESQEAFLALSKSIIESSLEVATRIAALDSCETRLADVTANNHALERTVESLKRAQSKLMEEAHKMGMSDVASGVLHDVGNVLNSVNVSTASIVNLSEKFKVDSLQKAVALLIENKASLDKFLTEDEFGKQLLSFIKSVADDLSLKQIAIQKEAAALSSNVDHVKSVISIQQSYTRASGLLEQCSLLDVLNDAVNLGLPRHEDEGISVVYDFEAIPLTWMNRHRVIQIIVNLVSNARNALLVSGKKRKELKISVFRSGPNQARIAVIDNGIGVHLQNLQNIFAQGFSTRGNGHGLGLHNSANAAKELGGKIWCESKGPDCGASFFLDLPLLFDTDDVSDDARKQ